MRFGRVIPAICSRRDRHTHRSACSPTGAKQANDKNQNKNQNRLFGMAAKHAGFAQLRQNTNTN